MKQKILQNLARIWKALKRELGNTEGVRDEFLTIAKMELEKHGFEYNESEVFQAVNDQSKKVVF